MVLRSVAFIVLILVFAHLCRAQTTQPCVGVHTSAGSQASLKRLGKSIPGLAKLGVSAIVVEVDYGFDFKSHPELVHRGVITLEDAKQFAALCRANHIRVIPSLNCLGHQSWSSHTAELLTKHPELDETPGKYPENKGIYCRSWCPSNPDTDKIVFPLIDELIAAFDADAFHVGMDEVFIMASDDCPLCKGKNPAELFALEVNHLHHHLVDEKKVEMFMWADRLIDATQLGYSKWEASKNGTAPAVELISHDIVLCDWHYGKQAEYKSVPYLMNKGFRVWPAGWHDVKAVEMLMDYSLAQKNPNLYGYLSTIWGKAQPDELDTFAPTILATRKMLGKQ
jgi:hypothetical protein